MKSVLFAVTLFTAGSHLVVTASAQAPLGSIATAKLAYTMRGGSAETGHGIDFTESKMDVDEKYAGVNIDVPGSYDSNSGSLSGFVFVGTPLGKIQVSASVVASAAWGAAFESEVSATGGYQDELTFENAPSANNPLGRLTVKGFMNLEGTLQAGTFGMVGVDAFSTVGLDVMGIGATPIHAGGFSQSITRQEGNMLVQEELGEILPAPATIEFTYLVTNNVPFLIDFEFTLHAYTKVVNRLRHEDFIGSGAASGDFAHTLSWGGIKSVTDAVTGEPVTEWAVTSASGFDYSQPAPEPSSLVLMAAAVTGLALVRNGRRGSIAAGLN